MQTEVSILLAFPQLNNLYFWKWTTWTEEKHSSTEGPVKKKEPTELFLWFCFHIWLSLLASQTRVLLLIPKAFQNQEKLALMLFSTIFKNSSSFQVFVQSPPCCWRPLWALCSPCPVRSTVCLFTMEFLAKPKQQLWVSPPTPALSKQRAGMQVSVWEEAEFMSCFGNQHLTTPCIQLVVSRKEKWGATESACILWQCCSDAFLQ